MNSIFIIKIAQNEVKKKIQADRKKRKSQIINCLFEKNETEENFKKEEEFFEKKSPFTLIEGRLETLESFFVPLTSP